MNTVQHSPAPRRLGGAAVNIPPRRPGFAFKAATTRRYIFDNSPFMSTLIASLSALFPEGERFFVESVRPYRQQITDPVLSAQIAGFIGQESLHGKEHDALNAVFLEHGFDVRRIDRQLAWMAKGAHRRFPRPFQLAVTAAFEHLTALFGEELLSNPELQARFDEQTRPLWLWHALEETEHKTVAFDVLEQISQRNYLLRAGTMIPVTLIFFGFAFGFQLRLLKADGRLGNWRDNLRGINTVFGPRGLFTRLIPKYLDYFRPGYHPSQHHTEALVQEWREKLFGVGGPLHDSLNRQTPQEMH
jgi:predicted metal-dependent hydrolase